MSKLYSLPDSKDHKTPTFNEPHSPAIRIWHWTFFVGITASLVTVLFGSTLFRTKNNIAIVQSQIQEKGAIISKDQAKGIAHMYSDKLWDLHTIIGYVLCGLLLTRIVIEITQPGEEKLMTRIKKAMGFQPGSPSAQQERQHYVRVKWTYLIFYGLITTMALTGLGLAFEDVPVLKSWHKTISLVHSVVQYFIYGFIFLHLAGIIRAELGNYKGLVSRMIHGEGRN